MLRQIQDPRSLPIPTDITSHPNSREHSPLQSWYQASPVISVTPAFYAPSSTAPVPHVPFHWHLASTPIVGINVIVKAVVQVTLVANARSTAANPTTPSLVPTLTQPAGGPHPSENFFLKSWNGGLHSFPIS